MEIKIECSKCGQHVAVDDWSVGQVFACPGCGQSLRVAPPPPAVPQQAPAARAAPAADVQTNVKQGAATGGWVCFGLGAVFMFIPFPTWFIYTPLFLASFILSIVAISQKRIASGITLLLASVVGAPILFIIALAVGLATVAQALGRAQRRTAEVTNASAPSETTQPSPTRNSKSAAEVAPLARPSGAAADSIEGAFGKKLGEVFNPAYATGISKLTDGTPMYEFSTPIGFRSFKRYYVMITPVTHKIYSIWGIGSVESTGAGQKEQAVVMELLRQKYGSEEKQGAFDALGDVKRIDHGNRYILTKISGFMDVTIEIRYYDGDLEKLAEKERLAEEAKKADKSGL